MGFRNKLIKVLSLNCDEKENRIFLVKKFKSIKYVQKHIEDIKNYDEIRKVSNKILEKTNFLRLCILYEKEYLTCNLCDNESGKLYTVYARNLKELDMKASVFSYYFRKDKD